MTSHPCNNSLPDEVPSSSSSQEKFLVDLGGVLSVLSESIYTAGPEVFVRELMQNGQDAITARRLLSELDFQGAMSIEAITDADGAVTVIVEDNGIGLTQEESRRALATIAFSMKKTDGMSSDDSPFVGRFGIGILSGFLVADEISIFSRRAGSNVPSVHWVGNINGTFSTHSTQSMAEPGTRVFMRLRPEAAGGFGADDILDIAQKYGRYLPHPITFRQGSHSTRVNDTKPLWEQPLGREELLEAGNEVFDETMLSSFHFQSDEAGASGLAFIKAESCHAGAESTHTVFIKNMLVSERALDIEPPGAPFLSIIMNSDRLRPNAGRDCVMANDQRLPALRRDIESALLNHLDELHRKDPQRLAAVVHTQYRCLAQLATKNRAYLRFLLDHLPMETTLGRMPLGALFRRHASVVEYVTNGTDFQRLQAKAHTEGDCIVRVETESAHCLIDLVSQSSEGAKAKRITSKEYLGRFTSKSMAPSHREAAMLAELNIELAKENCAGVFYETDDPDEIVRLEMSTDESLDRLLDLETDGTAGAKKLLLNRLHPMISQMISGAADAQQLRAWLRLIYHLALLQAREVPTVAETRRFSRSIGNIFTSSTLAPL